MPSVGKVPSQEKTDYQKLIDVDDAENLPYKEKADPNVALYKAKLHQYLKSKDLIHQLPAENEEKNDPQSLEAILTEYTALDVLDEENKFICNTCTENRKLIMLAKCLNSDLYSMVSIAFSTNMYILVTVRVLYISYD